MGLFNTLNTGVTGLSTNGLSLSVTGDNLANLNTHGFKGSAAQFQDLVHQSLGGNRGQLGQGAFTGRVSQSFQQGGLEVSSRNSDLAVDGNGFFVVADQEGTDYYSRAGQFELDASGNLVNLVGMKLQGFTIDASGTLSTTVGDITVPTDTIPGQATSAVTLSANLDADAATTVFTAAPPDFTTIANEATFTSSSVVYDSLGAAHDVTVAFYKTGVNAWEMRAFVDAGEAGGTAGVPQEIFASSMNFLSSGALDQATSTSTATAVNFAGATGQTINFDVGIAAADIGSMTQFAAASDIASSNPNGNGSGSLVDFDIATDGIVKGIYSNGESRTLGQVALASFQGQSYLERVGHNLYQSTTESGQPAVGAAGNGGRGVVHSYALEMSNVDIENQFVRMIKSQKGYQASARVVSGADDLLQELMQIV
ncbi:MAG TPA: flagellar hook protein FlgE [Deltaproteobacteria bacterium]|nr:flagellar biosynthesis protein FlgE [Deltaproteobacteria bacterium]HCP45370.1 flagellar hook protein FlgE [Deltaproteobacteria bacterium]